MRTFMKYAILFQYKSFIRKMECKIYIYYDYDRFLEFAHGIGTMRQSQDVYS